MINFGKGDSVRITAAGIGGEDRTVDGWVLFASPNGRSLALGFEAILCGHAGMMPVFREDDGSYVTLFGQHPVQIVRGPR